MTKVVHVLTLNPKAGEVALNLALAGISAIFKSQGVSWWVEPPASAGSGVRIMARVPKDMTSVGLQELLNAYVPPPGTEPVDGKVRPW